MTFNDVLEHFSSRKKSLDVAEALNVSKGTVSIWKSKGIPHERQCQIEIFTKGVLKAAKTTN